MSYRRGESNDNQPPVFNRLGPIRHHSSEDTRRYHSDPAYDNRSNHGIRIATRTNDYNKTELSEYRQYNSVNDMNTPYNPLQPTSNAPSIHKSRFNFIRHPEDNRSKRSFSFVSQSKNQPNPEHEMTMLSQSKNQPNHSPEHEMTMLSHSKLAADRGQESTFININRSMHSNDNSSSPANTYSMTVNDSQNTVNKANRPTAESITSLYDNSSKVVSKPPSELVMTASHGKTMDTPEESHSHASRWDHTPASTNDTKHTPSEKDGLKERKHIENTVNKSKDTMKESKYNESIIKDTIKGSKHNVKNIINGNNSKNTKDDNHSKTSVNNIKNTLDNKIIVNIKNTLDNKNSVSDKNTVDNKNAVDSKNTLDNKNTVHSDYRSKDVVIEEHPKHISKKTTVIHTKNTSINKSIDKNLKKSIKDDHIHTIIDNHHSIHSTDHAQKSLSPNGLIHKHKDNNLHDHSNKPIFSHTKPDNILKNKVITKGDQGDNISKKRSSQDDPLSNRKHPRTNDGSIQQNIQIKKTVRNIQDTHTNHSIKKIPLVHNIAMARARLLPIDKRDDVVMDIPLEEDESADTSLKRSASVDLINDTKRQKKNNNTVDAIIPTEEDDITTNEISKKEDIPTEETTNEVSKKEDIPIKETTNEVSKKEDILIIETTKEVSKKEDIPIKETTNEVSKKEDIPIKETTKEECVEHNIIDRYESMEEDECTAVSADNLKNSLLTIVHKLKEQINLLTKTAKDPSSKSMIDPQQLPLNDLSNEVALSEYIHKWSVIDNEDKDAFSISSSNNQEEEEEGMASPTTPAGSVTSITNNNSSRRLPEPWRVVMTETGDISYINTKTMEQRSIRPIF